MCKKRLLIIILGVVMLGSIAALVERLSHKAYDRKIEFFTEAVSKSCDYYYDDSEVRCDMINIAGEDLFIVSQGCGFDIYRFVEAGTETVTYMSTFSDDHILYYDDKNRLFLSTYHNDDGREIHCITRMNNDWSMSLIESFGTIDAISYKDLKSTYSGYFGQRIMPQVEGGKEDTCAYFYGGVAVSKGELSKIPGKYMFYKKLDYTIMKNKYNGIIYREVPVQFNGKGRVIID